MPRLETRDLTLRIGNRLLLRDLSVAFEAGQNWAILGANGSGKTTLLHTLAGLRRADGGDVLLDGQAMQQIPRRVRAQKLGILFQDTPNAFPASVFETVLSGRRRTSVSGSRKRRRTTRWHTRHSPPSGSPIFPGAVSPRSPAVNAGAWR